MMEQGKGVGSTFVTVVNDAAVVLDLLRVLHAEWLAIALSKSAEPKADKRNKAGAIRNKVRKVNAGWNLVLPQLGKAIGASGVEKYPS